MSLLRQNLGRGYCGRGCFWDGRTCRAACDSSWRRAPRRGSGWQHGRPRRRLRHPVTLFGSDFRAWELTDSLLHPPGTRAPIGGHEAAEGGDEVAGAEVVEAGFGVAFFAGEFVGQRSMLN